MTEQAQVQRPRNIVATVIGSLLEWYDFAIYGFLAATIGKLFFPADDPFASLLAAFGVFAIGYLARPAGAVLFGHIGDRMGRKRSLVLSISLMGLGTFGIGILPDSSQIGSVAAILLLLLRILQGLAMGGESTGSIVFLAESAPTKRRGFYACWPQFGCLVGVLLGSAVAALSGTLLGETVLEDWGWRVPFLFGAVIAVVGQFLRRHLVEPPALANAKPLQELPVVVTFRDYWRTIARLVALILVTSIGYYMQFVYAVSYLTEEMHLSTTRALDINTLALLVMLLVTLPAALLSDRIGRKPLLAFVALGSIFGAWPLWWLMHQDSFGLILLGQCGFAVLYGVGFSVITATMIEMLPTQVRCSGSAIGFGICLGLFGGTTPLVVTYLVERTADDFLPAYYLMLAGAVSLAALWHLPETAGKPLMETA